MSDSATPAAAEVLAVCAALAGTGVLIWLTLHSSAGLVQTSGAEEKKTFSVSLSGGHTFGSESARIAVVEYSDFQCPFCGGFARFTQKALEKEYVDTGKVRWAFRHLPLEAHKMAATAAQAAECAAMDGKFWQMHDSLFSHQDELDSPGLMRQARAIGVLSPRFTMCLSSLQVRQKVTRDRNGADALNIAGTPTFLFGFVADSDRAMIVDRISGAAAQEVFEKVIDGLLARAPAYGLSHH